MPLNVTALTGLHTNPSARFTEGSYESMTTERHYEWGIESSAESERGYPAEQTSCGHLHPTVPAALACLADSTNAATGGRADHIAGAIVHAVAAGEAGKLTWDEIEELAFSTSPAAI